MKDKIFEAYEKTHRDEDLDKYATNEVLREFFVLSIINAFHVDSDLTEEPELIFVKPVKLDS